ncbi:MAG: glycosyltransferase family 2 protein [Ktedonobacteraceae bacterium]|nr:glycosyltransferase family 2 protein [Ktedonobacteraceae bacterium]
MAVLQWLLLIVEGWIALPIAYLFLLSLSALLAARRRTMQNARPVSGQVRFALLIPAHNEEMILRTLLESLALLDYPKDRYTVYVIADNCTDKTAELARQTGGVEVYERFDVDRRGKGYALNWMWQQLKERHLTYDAYVILDADSVVVPAFLRAMERELAGGARALQACNTVLNVTASPSTALRWIALTLINHVRPLGRNGIGASSTLTGNGMCLSHDLLERHPWQAFGIAEDYQYYLTLVEHGERVRYVPEAVVRSQMPTTFAQMRTQDVRWEASGQQQSQWRIALRLLKAAIRSRSLLHIEAVAELLTPPLSFLVLACLVTLVASILLWSLPAVVLNLALWSALFCYIATAFYLLRPPQSVYKALLHAPGFMLWKLWVYFVLSRSKKHTSEWVRTKRISS